MRFPSTNGKIKIDHLAEETVSLESLVITPIIEASDDPSSIELDPFEFLNICNGGATVNWNAILQDGPDNRDIFRVQYETQIFWMFIDGQWLIIQKDIKLEIIKFSIGCKEANHRLGMVKSQFAVWCEILNVLKYKINVSLQFRQVRIGLPKQNIIRECTDLTFILDNTLTAS
ncbi:hypothetical protein TNCV_4419341 [Trichonephila clavipes]|nr:hypothetical protein TNCV_4419341 [Trichonephila clavipes]